MRTAIQLAAEAGPWTELVTYVTEAEHLGVNCCWVAEAWGGDAATPIAALSQHTDQMIFGSGILQVGARSAANTAMVGLTLQRITGDRFILGLGASGPQVVEGLHGVSFTRPLTRMRETIEVIRMAEAGERLAYEGQTMVLPLPDGEGKALRLSLRSNGNPLKIYLASLSPRMLELTGEVADGWLGTSFIPEGAQSSLDALTAGAGRAGRSLTDLELCQGAEVAFADDPEDLAGMVASRKPGLAFSLGGMGSATTNYYNDAYARQGYAEVAAESQALWLDGHRNEAAAVIPDEMVLATTLIGTKEMVADRLRAWEHVGIDQVRLYPAGSTLEERLTTLGQALDLVRDLGAAT
ncbi:MAG: LLM class flavin-dependent oxidoreductase [Actinomycetota bacterium]|nr:LLM class flavin-dependent oxidoreductase [Actinomycetota bacterium]